MLLKPLLVSGLIMIKQYSPLLVDFQHVIPPTLRLPERPSKYYQIGPQISQCRTQSPLIQIQSSSQLKFQSGPRLNICIRHSSAALFGE